MRSTKWPSNIESISVGSSNRAKCPNRVGGALGSGAAPSSAARSRLEPGGTARMRFARGAASADTGDPPRGRSSGGGRRRLRAVAVGRSRRSGLGGRRGGGGGLLAGREELHRHKAGVAVLEAAEVAGHDGADRDGGLKPGGDEAVDGGGL